MLRDEKPAITKPTTTRDHTVPVRTRKTSPHSPCGFRPPTNGTRLPPTTGARPRGRRPAREERAVIRSTRRRSQFGLGRRRFALFAPTLWRCRRRVAGEIVAKTCAAESENCLVQPRRSAGARQCRSKPFRPRFDWESDPPERCVCFCIRHRCFSVARERYDSA